MNQGGKLLGEWCTVAALWFIGLAANGNKAIQSDARAASGHTVRYNYQLAVLNWLSILLIFPIGSNSNFIIIYNSNYRLVREISSGIRKGRQA